MNIAKFYSPALTRFGFAAVAAVSALALSGCDKTDSTRAADAADTTTPAQQAAAQTSQVPQSAQSAAGQSGTTRTPATSEASTSAESVTQATGAAQAAAAASIYEQNGLKVYPAPASVQYPEAALKLEAPESGAVIAGQSVPFSFDVSDFELGIETADAASKGLANSGMGQHIHLIVDNGPYSAHYEADFTEEVANPGHHIGIAFLSRSYHESVKEPTAYQLFQFTTGEDVGAAATETVDLEEPMLFYSRPKGAYAGDETKEVLLDFYVVNTELSDAGHRAKVTVNDQDTFYITQWAPYVIEGLPLGENTITVELVDAEGNAVDSPLGKGGQMIQLKGSADAGSSGAAHGHAH